MRPKRPPGHDRFRDARPNRSVAALFGDTVSRQPDSVAVIEGALRLTQTELARRVRSLASELARRGVGAGDVVAYQLPNWWEAAAIFLAAARLGATVNPLLPMFRERELRFTLAQSAARLLVIPGRYRDYDYRELIAGIRGELPALEHVVVCRDQPGTSMEAFPALESPENRAAPEPEEAGDPQATLLLMYTSGTTATPKGVVHTHDTLAAEIFSLTRVHQLTPADRCLMPSPVTHISGVVHAILTPALLGTSAVLMDRWDPGHALDLIERERVTYMAGAPTFLKELIEHARLADADTSSLRLFSCGGADVSADLVRRARRALPSCVTKRVYGSTELPTLTTTDATDAHSRGADSEGRPIPPNEVRIVGAEGVELPAGEEGEVQACGPECFIGYTDDGLTAESFTADGWFRTGDLGVLDADGYLRITGRLKEIVIRKGEKISIRELEELIAKHPAVLEVAVLAVPDRETGERACAAVRLRTEASLTLPDLGAFLTARGVAKQKQPEQLAVWEDLPRTESGKMNRAALRDAFAGDRPRGGARFVRP